MAGEEGKKPGGYGKRPLWQWIVLYVIIGAIVYFGIYYVYAMHKSNSGSGYGNNNTTQNSPY
jgi:hypothetical protein